MQARRGNRHWVSNQVQSHVDQTDPDAEGMFLIGKMRFNHRRNAGEEIDAIDQPFAPKPCPLKVSLFIKVSLNIIRKKDTGKTRG